MIEFPDLHFRCVIEISEISSAPGGRSLEISEISSAHGYGHSENSEISSTQVGCRSEISEMSVILRDPIIENSEMSE